MLLHFDHIPILGICTVYRGVRFVHPMHKVMKSKEVIQLTDYNLELIDLLNEKIMRLENDKDRQRKEINRLKRELTAHKKQIGDNEPLDPS